MICEPCLMDRDTSVEMRRERTVIGGVIKHEVHVCPKCGEKVEMYHAPENHKIVLS